MSALAKCDDSKVRAKHRSWDSHVSYEPMFRNCVTIDIRDVDDVWAHLSVNSAAVEFQEIPVRLHRSLVNALRRSMARAEKP